MTHRYLAYGLVTDEFITELPLTDVKYGRILNGAGPFTAKLRLPEPFDLEGRLLAATYLSGSAPLKVAVYVERDGVLIDGYMLWTREWDEDGRTCTLSGAGLWSYFRHRLLRYDTGGVSADQLLYAQNIIAYTQLLGTGSDIHVQVGAETSGVSRIESWTAQQLKPVAEAIEDLSDNYPGFDFSIDVAYESGVPVRRLHCWYPRKGRSFAFTGHVFELGRNIISLNWPEDGTRTANTVIAQGAGTGETMVTATAVDTGQLAAGYPLLEASASFKDVILQATLEGHAQGVLGDVRTVAVLPKITVDGSQDPVVGAFTEGDDCRIRVQPGMSPRWPDGLEKYTRITAWSVDVPDDGGVEKVSLTLNEVAA